MWTGEDDYIEEQKTEKNKVKIEQNNADPNHSSEIRNLISKKCENNVVINATSSPWAYFGCFSGFQFAAQIKWVLSSFFHLFSSIQTLLFQFSCGSEKTKAKCNDFFQVSLPIHVLRNCICERKKHTRILISNWTNLCKISGVMWSLCYAGQRNRNAFPIGMRKIVQKYDNCRNKRAKCKKVSLEQ